MGQYYILELKNDFVETNNIFSNIPIISQENFAFDEFILKVETLIINKNIKYIIIKEDQSFSAMPGQLEQILSVFKRLKENNKKLIYFSKNYSLKSLFLSSICDERISPLLGSFIFTGLKFSFNFFKRAMDKLDIKIEVYRRGKYKGALDRFRLDSIDEAQKEAYGKILEGIYNCFKDEITKNLNISTELYENKIYDKILKIDEAKDLNIITDIKNFKDIEEDFKKKKIKKIKKINISKSFGKGKKVVILNFDGGIKDGKNDSSPLFGKQIGDDYYLKEIDKIAKNKKIKAVIFKVNSGGGSALASDAIASALYDLRKDKILVVVQSGVAGSGGYFISFPAEKIFTQRTTITGSIGVINGMFYMKNLYDKIGITRSELKKGEHADWDSTFRERTEEEKKLIDFHIEDIYQKFISKVAEARKKSIDYIDSIGQGRIWSGLDGVEIGITDEIGDIYKAIDYIKNKLNCKSLNISFLPKKKTSFINKLLFEHKNVSIGINDIKLKNEMLNYLSVINEFDKLNNKNLLFIPELLFGEFKM
jgi:protease-4